MTCMSVLVNSHVSSTLNKEHIQICRRQQKVDCAFTSPFITSPSLKKLIISTQILYSSKKTMLGAVAAVCLVAVLPMEVVVFDNRYSLLVNNSRTMDSLEQTEMRSWPDWVLSLLINYAYCQKHDVAFSPYSYSSSSEPTGAMAVKKMKTMKSKMVVHLKQNSFFSQPDVSPTAFVQLLEASGACNDFERNTTAVSEYTVIKGHHGDAVALWNLMSFRKAQRVASTCINETTTQCPDAPCRLCVSSYAVTCDKSLIGGTIGRYIKTLPSSVRDMAHLTRIYSHALVATAEIHYKEQAIDLLRQIIDRRLLKKFN
eukprot:TRINITY_DN17170_c0_g1_i1.p1 TRINITY_DN17170_c0_g1~~TRINITY_DN17170_c0_g1_i1.p1  ORF type:complete len:314 (+),score=35.08 TRINITY_DN17170_c0_g1_i1:46-987(+)